MAREWILTVRGLTLAERRAMERARREGKYPSISAMVREKVQEIIRDAEKARTPDKGREGAA